MQHDETDKGRAGSKPALFHCLSVWPAWHSASSGLFPGMNQDRNSSLEAWLGQARYRAPADGSQLSILLPPFSLLHSGIRSAWGP